MPGDRAPGEPEYAYLVLAARVFVIAHVQEPVGAGSDLRDVVEQADDVQRRAVMGIASHVDERLAVHPAEVEQVGTGHLRDAQPQPVDDPPQPDVIIVTDRALPAGDPAVVFVHAAILARQLFLTSGPLWIHYSLLK